LYATFNELHPPIDPRDFQIWPQTHPARPRGPPQTF